MLLLVFGRDAHSLGGIYANGGYGFLHDMVEIAGGRDVFEDVKRENVQASTELILARRPEIIIELHPPSDAPRRSHRRGNTLSSLPAVRNRRVHQLVGDEFLDAGPRVADADGGDLAAAASRGVDGSINLVIWSSGHLVIDWWIGSLIGGLGH